MKWQTIRRATDLADLGVETTRALRRRLAVVKEPEARAELAAALLAVAHLMRAAVSLELALIRDARASARTRNAGFALSDAAPVVPPGTVKH